MLATVKVGSYSDKKRKQVRVFFSWAFSPMQVEMSHKNTADKYQNHQNI
jgi:hypothetical protein